MKKNIGKPQPKHTAPSSESEMTNLSFLAEGKYLDTNSFCATGYTQYMVPGSNTCLKAMFCQVLLNSWILSPCSSCPSNLPSTRSQENGQLPPEPHSWAIITNFWPFIINVPKTCLHSMTHQIEFSRRHNIWVVYATFLHQGMLKLVSNTVCYTALHFSLGQQRSFYQNHACGHN